MPDIPIELAPNARVVEGEHNADNIKITLSEDMRGYPVYIVRRKDGYGKTSDSKRLYEQDGAVLMPLTEDILRGSSLKLQLIALNEDFTEVAKSETVTIDVSASLRMSGEQKQKSKDLLAEMLEALGKVEGAVDSIGGAVENAEKAVENAEQAVNSANEAVKNANSATETANNAAEKADKAAENANTSAESAYNAASSANQAAQIALEAAENVQDGADGTTFIPSVDSDGNLSWINSDDKPNPAPVNIKGPAGYSPVKGKDYFDGTTFTPSVDSDGNLSWKNSDNKPNPPAVNIKGNRGAPGFEEWVNMTSDDINVELQPNKLYVFPVMASLTYSFTADGEYHFVFFSGETPTEIIHPQNVLTGSLTIEPNRVYEISIIKNSMGGLLLSESWEAAL